MIYQVQVYLQIELLTHFSAYQGVKHCMDACEFPLSLFEEFPLSPAFRFLSEPLNFMCLDKHECMGTIYC